MVFFFFSVKDRNVQGEKCKVNDVTFPSGCETRAINLGNKNRKIGIFTGGTSVRSKNIFTDISRYPTGKHEITESCFRHPLFDLRRTRKVEIRHTNFHFSSKKVTSIFLLRPHYNVCLSAPNDVGGGVDSVA